MHEVIFIDWRDSTSSLYRLPACRGKNTDLYSAGNNFSYLAGHVSFQVFILVGHITNLVGH